MVIYWIIVPLKNAVRFGSCKPVDYDCSYSIAIQTLVNIGGGILLYSNSTVY